jgi:hypothetical protein
MDFGFMNLIRYAGHEKVRCGDEERIGLERRSHLATRFHLRKLLSIVILQLC